jgi:cell division protein ZapB
MSFLIYSYRMEDDLKILEEKLTHLLGLFNEMRTENSALKAELETVKKESVELKGNMTQASERIETLMRSLP